jgi:hypothetical protein
MQFEPTRYQVDVDFQVRGTMGMVARELEQQVMVNLLQFTEQGTPPYLLLLKAVFDQSSSPVKTEMRQTIDAMLKPDPKAQQQAEMMKQLQMQSVMEEVRNTRADTALKIAQGDKAKADTLLSQIEAHFKEDEQLIENLKVIIDRQEVAVQERQLAQNDRKLDIEEKKAARPAGSA